MKKNKPFNLGEEWKLYVRRDKWDEYKKHREINSLIYYNQMICLLEDFALRFLEFGSLHKPPKPVKISCEEAWNKALTLVKGLSISQVDLAAGEVVRYSKRGDEFLSWWNRKHAGEQGEQATKLGKRIVSNVIILNGRGDENAKE